MNNIPFDTTIHIINAAGNSTDIDHRTLDRKSLETCIYDICLPTRTTLLTQMHYSVCALSMRVNGAQPLYDLTYARIISAPSSQLFTIY